MPPVWFLSRVDVDLQMDVSGVADSGGRLSPLGRRCAPAAVARVASQMTGNGFNSVTNVVHNAENVHATFSAFRLHCRIQMDQPQYYTDCIGDFSLRPGWGKKNDELRSTRTRCESEQGFHSQAGSSKVQTGKSGFILLTFLPFWFF